MNPFVTQFNRKIALVELSVHKEPTIVTFINWKIDSNKTKLLLVENSNF